MNLKTKRVLEKTKGKSIGLFIDNANWFYPQRELGWQISFSKLKKFLAKYCSFKVLRLYAGTPLDDKDKKSFDRFRKAVEKAGFTFITKPLKKIWVDRKSKQFIYKANFDVEIALDVARHIAEIDLVVIGSGDSDFLEIRNFAFENKKGFIALCFEKGIAWEVRKNYHLFLEELKEFVELK